MSDTEWRQMYREQVDLCCRCLGLLSRARQIIVKQDSPLAREWLDADDALMESLAKNVKESP